MFDLVFVGAEAHGYYSGAHACEGVFVRRDYYEKYKEELTNVFGFKTFCELDGKHSEVEGDLIVKNINSITDVAEVVFDLNADYDTYVFEDYIEEEDYQEELSKHISEVYENVKRVIEDYSPYKIALTAEEYKKVSEYIEKLRGGWQNV
ncbi:hypothetical protein [Bacillus chungangensis]|uniref:Uncharacterized protein n=1 Tax=Bacillus chungangensis TaxID=587633 RepID=A0ABT9WMF0_9BACI|nr:hypothetical protein [Bacillus chungangensis]MDQ0174431.1 hypothetical protein [Bacillus chungangensis]